VCRIDLRHLAATLEEMRMSSRASILLLAVAVLAPSAIAQAKDKPSSAALPSPSTITTEQFEALGPNDMIEVNGQRMAKQQFLTRVETAAVATQNKVPDAQAQAQARFEARRKAFLDDQQAKLNDAKGKAQAAAKPLLDQATAGRPANYDASVAQATALLKRAASASPSDAAEIESQAGALLKIIDPEAAKTLAK
jgi:hypothetical protein